MWPELRGAESAYREENFPGSVGFSKRRNHSEACFAPASVSNRKELGPAERAVSCLSFWRLIRLSGSWMERTSSDRQQETFVSTQHVLRVEQAHPSTLETYPVGGTHISSRSGTNSDAPSGRSLSQVDQKSLRHRPRDLQLPVGRNGAEWQARSVTSARWEKVAPPKSVQQVMPHFTVAQMAAS